MPALLSPLLAGKGKGKLMSNHKDSPSTFRPLLQDCIVCEAQPGEACRSENAYQHTYYRCPDDDCDQEWLKESEALSCVMHLEDYP